MKRNSFGVGCAVAMIFAAGLACLYNGCQPKRNVDETQEVVEISYDTIPIFISTPKPTDSTILRYETVVVPIRDTLLVPDTAKIDSVNVVVPIMQKVFRDSIYQAWVSGYNPSLDSIHISQRTTTITRTITNTEVQYKAKRWSVGVHLGVGVTPRKVEPYIGIGIAYNIFSW